MKRTDIMSMNKDTFANKPSLNPRIIYLLGVFSLVISGALWGSEGAPVRISYAHGMTPLSLSLFRATFASIIMGIYAIYMGRKDVFILSRTELFPCFISGCFGVGICSTAAAFAMGRIPIGLTFLLINTAPFWVMILARIIWKERVTWFQMIALFIGISGVWFAVGGVKFQPYNVLGLIGALGAGLGYAIYVLNGKHGMGKEDPLKAYVQMFIWGALCLWIICISTGQLSSLLVSDWEAWISVLYLTVFPGIGAFGILMLSLRVVSGGVAAIVSMTEIPFSMLWSWLFLSEIPSISALKGGILIIGAVTMLSLEGFIMSRKPDNLRSP